VDKLTYSIVIPVYKNEGSIEPLVDQLAALTQKLSSLEVVFVVDGSPDASYEKLRRLLPGAPFASQLVALSRNFGSFPAVSAGLSVASGEYTAVIAADLQEPPELTLEFFAALESGDCDIVLGRRMNREDPLASRLAAEIFWGLYRRLVQRELPPGGIDVFGCNRQVREMLTSFTETNTSLIGLLLWVGFRRREVTYRRLARQHGRSAWSFRKKFRYLKDSVFAFSDLPIRLLGWAGLVGVTASLCLALAVLVAKLEGSVRVPGYAATAIAILFFGGINSLGLSVIGEYIWRNFENSKQRPRFIIFQRQQFGAAEGPGRRGVEQEVEDGRVLPAR
jgi:glycosyltransferase involved in cell wall biosynthesis